MTVKTRYFVIVSLLVVAAGLGTGLVAYYVGFPTSAFLAVPGGPDELRYLPSTAAVVAYADVHAVMASELRQRFRASVLPGAQENGQREFQELTGINIETDIDHVVACLDPGDNGTDSSGSGVVLAHGRFVAAKIEALMSDHGAHVEQYQGKRLIVADHLVPDPKDVTPQLPPQIPVAPPVPQVPPSFSLTFVDPDLVAFGTTDLVRHVIDLHKSGGESARTNTGLMAHVRSLDGSNAWAVGRFDVLRARAKLPDVVADRLPPITWFTVSGEIDGGLKAVLSAETRDDDSAKNLREVIQGFLALAKLQTSSKPEFQRFVNSLEIRGTGNTVALSLDVPAQLFDALGAAVSKSPKKQ
jgi:hypothetical protein